MTAEKKTLSFGSYLKTLRIEKGISLEEVSREIKVSVEMLLLIEKGDHERLPAEVFVKGFLRAYAKAIGADGDAAVQRYLADRRAISASDGLDAEMIETTTSVWPRFIISICAVFCIAGLSLLGVSFYQNRHAGGDSRGYDTGNERHGDVSGRNTQEEGPSERHGAAPKKKLLLKIIAIEDTQVKLTIDDHDPETHNLRRSERLELEGSSGFYLEIGNAGGVQVLLNEKILTIPGKSGQPATIRIP